MMKVRCIFALSWVLAACGSETDSRGTPTPATPSQGQSENAKAFDGRRTPNNQLSAQRLEIERLERPTLRTIEASWSAARQVNLYDPLPEVAPERSRRRMNIDQLEAAFVRVSGGLNWTERRNGRDESLFQSLSVTLGKPDYIQTTNEVLEPTALFQKFLDDAARQVCQKMVERDQASAEPVLMIRNLDEEQLNQHLAGLVLRFHSRDLAPNSNDLAQWRWLYDTVSVVEQDSASRWMTVCTALFTHPDFYSF